MSHPTENEVGYSIKLPGTVGAIATLGTLGNIFQRTDTTFSIILDACFLDDNYNVFLGGSQAASSFKFIRNKTAGKIDLELIDESGDHRDYTWTAPLNRGVWYNFIINGVANGADGIALYVDSSAKTASAQTNDAGYDPTVSMSLKLGDIDAVNLGGVKVAKILAYARNLTAQEISDIRSLRKYPSDFSYAWNFKRPNIGL